MGEQHQEDTTEHPQPEHDCGDRQQMRHALVFGRAHNQSRQEDHRDRLGEWGT